MNEDEELRLEMRSAAMLEEAMSKSGGINGGEVVWEYLSDQVGSIVMGVANSGDMEAVDQAVIEILALFAERGAL